MVRQTSKEVYKDVLSSGWIGEQQKRISQNLELRPVFQCGEPHKIQWSFKKKSPMLIYTQK